MVREWHKPVTEMEEVPTNPEVGKEVEGYVERIEKETELSKPVLMIIPNKCGGPGWRQ